VARPRVLRLHVQGRRRAEAPKDKVLEIAKGASGRARTPGLGLVDALGGFDVALKLAKEAAKIPAATT
jgi:ClpP class serine protease